MVGLVLAQDPPQMGLVPDEGAVQEFAAASPDPSFGDRVHPGRLDVAEHGPDPGIGEDRVERSGEVRSAVADHELDPVRLPAEVHDQVAGLLDGSRAGWMPGVTPRMRMRRVACSITARTYAWVPSSSSAVKKSHARIVSAWERKNCDQVGSVRRGTGSIPASSGFPTPSTPLLSLPGRPAHRGSCGTPSWG